MDLGRNMKRLAIVLLVLILALGSSGVAPVAAGTTYQSITVVVQHVSPWGYVRPIAGARFTVTDLDTFVLGSDGAKHPTHYTVYTDRNGLAPVKLPFGHEYCWAADPVSGYIDYRYCESLGFNAGSGWLETNIVISVMFAGFCDGKGLY
jgi:hypothetical protein